MSNPESPLTDEEQQAFEVDRAECLREYLARSYGVIERQLEAGFITIEQAEASRTREFDFAHDLLFTTPESRAETEVLNG